MGHHWEDPSLGNIAVTVDQRPKGIERLIETGAYESMMDWSEAQVLAILKKEVLWFLKYNGVGS